MKRLVPTLLALALCAGAARAQAPRPSPDEAEQEAQSAMSQLRSPVTPSHTLDMCPSPEAAALRDTVRAEAALGVPADRIVEEVIARRGEQMRIVPKGSGFGAWAWILPPAVLLGGLGVVAVWMRRARGGASAALAPAGTLSAEDRDLLAAELAAWEREPEGVE